MACGAVIHTQLLHRGIRPSPDVSWLPIPSDTTVPYDQRKELQGGDENIQAGKKHQACLRMGCLEMNGSYTTLGNR